MASATDAEAAPGRCGHERRVGVVDWRYRAGAGRDAGGEECRAEGGYRIWGCGSDGHRSRRRVTTPGRLSSPLPPTRLCPAAPPGKCAATGAAIAQALAYVDWLLAHRDAVALRIARKLGIAQAHRFDWSALRLVCVDKAFGSREEVVARQPGGRAELVRIVRYGGGSSPSHGSSRLPAASSVLPRPAPHDRGPKGVPVLLACLPTRPAPAASFGPLCDTHR